MLAFLLHLSISTHDFLLFLLSLYNVYSVVDNTTILDIL